jgi:cytoskeletal protein CcmA (bactofilin family)
MAIQTVNLGTYANSNTGDDLRTAFEKVNANFAFLDLTSAVTANNIGLGARVFKEKIGDNLQLRSVVAGTGMTVVENTDNITVTSIIDITRDTAPELGGNLVLNSFNVTGTGNVNITGSITSTGNTVVGGDVAVNGGDLTTTATTFNLVNTTATTVNLAAAANFLNIGKTTGLTTVAGELQVNDDIVITNNGRLKTTNTSAYVFNETANYVFVGQSAVRVDLGSVNGTVGLGHNGEVANNFTVSGTIYGNFDSTQGTVDLLTVVNTLYANDISLSGNLSGNLVGNASTVTNGVYTTSSINALADVDTATSLPTNGQALVWNGSNWVPGSVAAGGGGNLDFGTFASPEGFTLDLGSF